MSMAARSSRRAAYAGRTASPGLALGPLVVDRPQARRARAAGDPARERSALESALADASAALAGLAAASDGDAADILEFQLALAGDPALSDPAHAAIAGGMPADSAWSQAVDALIADYHAAEEEYFRARAADLVDLRDRVLHALAGGEDGAAGLPEGAILIAVDLAPSRFLSTDWTGRGIVLEAGSPTSHVAMLARARGVPMLVGLGAVDAGDGETGLLDAEAGRLIVAPDADEHAGFAAAAARFRRRLDEEAGRSLRPAVTAAGERVQVLVNVADPAELGSLDPAICDGIGLARTELMFHGQARLPDEETQLAAYRRLLAWAAGRPVTVRTLDAGGDKPIPGYTLDNETNSFLGLRGVRLSLRHPDVFRVQVRALLRAAADGDIRIMIPMVAVPAEMERVREVVASAAAELDAAGAGYRLPPVGMMVEVPAAALALESFDTDFASIGSNDLVQYVMAASRDAAELGELADAGAPAVLSLIAMTVAKARARGMPVSLCGDAGGDPAVVPKLLGAGLRSLSVAPAAVGRVKAAIAAWGPGAP